MEFRATERPSHGRRSKLDIVGDMLRVISEGEEKPTKIMFRSNLTWPLTIAYLETLMRHDMVRSTAAGDKLTYHVTAKGSALLRSFIQTEEAAAELELDKLDSSLLTRAATGKRSAKAQEPPSSLNAIRLVMEKEGYNVAPSTVRGLSGVEHRFDMVLANDAGARIGYLVSENGASGDVIRAFILQTDCEFNVQVFCLAQPDAEARALADSYKLALIPVRNARSAG